MYLWVSELILWVSELILWVSELIRWVPGRTGGRLQGLCCAALDYFWNMFPGISGYPGNIGNMIFLDFWDFFQKRRAPKFHAEWSSFCGEISHLRPIQGQKLKLFQPPILPLFFPSSKPLATTMYHAFRRHCGVGLGLAGM